MTKIYTLSNPLTGEIRYIGKTSKDLSNRLKEHFRYIATLKVKTKRISWFKSLLKQNLQPKIELIDEVNDDEWQFWEMHYISLFKSWGFRLVNGTDGGTGGDVFTNNPNKESIRKKLSGSNSVGKRFLKGKTFPNRHTTGYGKGNYIGKNGVRWLGYVFVYDQYGTFIGKFDTAEDVEIKLNIGKNLIHNQIKLNRPVQKGKFKGYTFKRNKNENLCDR